MPQIPFIVICNGGQSLYWYKPYELTVHFTSLLCQTYHFELPPIQPRFFSNHDHLLDRHHCAPGHRHALHHRHTQSHSPAENRCPWNPEVFLCPHRRLNALAARMENHHRTRHQAGSRHPLRRLTIQHHRGCDSPLRIKQFSRSGQPKWMDTKSAHQRLFFTS